MIELETAVRQVARLSGLRGYPERVEALHEVVSAFQQACVSEAHASKVTDELLRVLDFFPVPKIVRETAWGLIDHEPEQSDCDECKGDGWKRGYFLVTWEGKRKRSRRITAKQAIELRGKVEGFPIQEVVSASEPCGCALGKRLLKARIKHAMEN